MGPMSGNGVGPSLTDPRSNDITLVSCVGEYVSSHIGKKHYVLSAMHGIK